MRFFFFLSVLSLVYLPDVGCGERKLHEKVKPIRLGFYTKELLLFTASHFLPVFQEIPEISFNFMWTQPGMKLSA